MYKPSATNVNNRKSTGRKNGKCTLSDKQKDDTVASALSSCFNNNQTETQVSPTKCPVGPNSLTLYSLDTHLTHQQQTALEGMMGKGEIARYEQFLLFTQCFQLNQKIVSLFVYIFDIVSLFAVELEEPKNGISGRGLNGEN